MTQEPVTLLAASIGIAGTLGAVIVSLRMFHSWQREQWLFDRRVEEFRKLLDALDDSFLLSMTINAGTVLDAEKQRAVVESHSNAMRAIRSLNFVAEEVVKFNIEVRWSEALNLYQHTLDVAELATVFNKIRRQIFNAARPTLLKRRFWLRRFWTIKSRTQA